MIVSVNTTGLKRAQWYEYVIRFGLGGFVTAGAGFIAKKSGASFGGLFLAFPAILAASSTLIEKHERERKEQKGLHGLYRGRLSAAADAAGAAMGSMGLIAFAWLVWKLMPKYTAWEVLAAATLTWALVSFSIWWIWKRRYLRRLRPVLFRRSRDI